MDYYFKQYESRKPELPLNQHPVTELLWQFFAVISIVLGAWYIHWRWSASLNTEALWYALPLVIAETGSYIGLLLFSFNLWKVKDTPMQTAPKWMSEVSDQQTDRPLSIDVFFPSYDEDPELVRLSVIDAKKITYPHTSVDIRIYVLDDTRRPEMQAMAAEEGVYYITRPDNVGFKAGNLRNAMEQSNGDFILICDADTRPFPTILSNTMGYFKDPDVAWVQTPQWFYDLDPGQNLSDYLKDKLWYPGYCLGWLTQRLFGEMRIGQDPFVSDPKMFYDIILRRRNWANASFCCGAGSIHRRSAVMRGALRRYSEDITRNIEKLQSKGLSPEEARRGAICETQFMPFRFHVSEDIYTSMVLHGDKDCHYKSVLHPEVESRMLSPQDLLSWSIQRFKYAAGTLDIARNDNPLFKSGMSLPQRLMYAATIWSYLGGIWNLIFLLAPIIYFMTGIAPVDAEPYQFFLHFIPFIIANEIATMFSTWGMPAYKAKASFISFFWLNLRALWTVFQGRDIKFPVTPKDRQKGNFAFIVSPHIAILLLTGIGIIYAASSHLSGYGNYHPGALIFNLFWALNNVLALTGIVSAAFWKPRSQNDDYAGQLS